MTAYGVFLHGVLQTGQRGQYFVFETEAAAQLVANALGVGAVVQKVGIS